MNKIIHQILILDEYCDVSKKMIKYNKKFYKDNYSDYVYNFWDEPKIIKFLEKNFDNKIVESFKSIRPYAYKSDFARYCILYVYGGWYIDMHSEPYMLPSTEKSAILFKDRSFVTQTEKTIANSIMYSTSKNKFLLDAIYEICDNINKLYYGNTPYCPTGPNLLGKIFFNQKDFNDYELGYCVDLDNGKPSPTFGYYYIMPNKKILGIAKNENSKFLNIKQYENYRYTWNQKNIYIINKNMKKIYLSDYPAIFINMDNNVINNKKMKKMLKEECMFNNIKRIKGALGRDKIHGVAIAHYNALSNSKNPVIIFEDDCKVLSFKNEIYIPNDADAIYLGVMPWGMSDGVAEFNKIRYQKIEGDYDIYKVSNLLGAHAILYISERFFEFAKNKILECTKTGEPNDVALANHHDKYNIYAVGTPMFYQDGYYKQQTEKHITEYINYTHEELTTEFKGKWSLR
jgi:mannosyltransferase OCH1-like enzyme